MTNPDQNEETTGTSAISELDRLKEQADSLGISYHPNIGLNKLKERMALDESIPDKTVKPIYSKITPIADNLTPAQQKAKIVKEALQLVRVRITCMNPNKKEWEGEIFTVSNSLVPTQKKYVPFNSDDGWHVPQIILNVIKERKCQIFKPVRGPNGEKLRKGFLVPEFSIEILDPLNEEELHELATQQAMANNLN